MESLTPLMLTMWLGWRCHKATRPDSEQSRRLVKAYQRPLYGSFVAFGEHSFQQPKQGSEARAIHSLLQASSRKVVLKSCNFQVGAAEMLLDRHQFAEAPSKASA